MDTPLASFGDMHLRDKAPEMRVDNYIDTQSRKLKWCFRQIPRNALVFFPGDVFNSSREPYHIIEMFMNLLNSRRDLYYIFIPGQHDMRYHNLDLHNTPIRLLQAGVRNSTLVDAGGSFIRGFLIYGRAYGAKVPKPLKNVEEKQILVAHKMMVESEDLYPGQDAILAKNFMCLYPFDIIISGDNHHRFIVENNRGQMLINMGSFIRMKTDQRQHKPAISIIENNKLEVIEIPISPYSEVFAKKESDTETKKLVKTIGEDFISGVKEEGKKGVTFLNRLFKKLENEERIVKKVMDKCLLQIGE